MLGTRSSPPTLLAYAAVVGVAVDFVVRRSPVSGFPAHDVYAYFYPNLLYALRSLGDGGRGLLWNPYQNCGQPFFANALTGLLYPPHWLFPLLGPDVGLRAVLAINMMIAGAATYWLCRDLGLGALAAAAGALAFELGNGTAEMTSWSPMHNGPYAWFPAAMLCTERILRAPSVRTCLALAAVLTLALLPGYPPIVLLMYQLLGLRVVWEVASRRAARPVASVVAMIAAFGLPWCFGAVQLLPMLEFTRESMRLSSLGAADMGAGLTWAGLQGALAFRSVGGNPHVLVPTLVATTAILDGGRRRQALFYLAALLLYFALAFGPGTPLFDFYARLPMAGMFRFPARFAWVTSFCAAMLTALGLDALTEAAGVNGRWSRVLGAVLPALGLVALHRWLIAGGLYPHEMALACVAIAGMAAACAAQRLRPIGGVVVLGAIAYNLVATPNMILQRLLPDGQPLAARWEAVEALRSRMRPEDRAYLLAEHPFATTFGFMQKTATVFGVPVIWDYEAEVSRRYAEFFTRMRTGRPLASLGDVLFAAVSPTPPGFERRMFDLTAARYLLVAPPLDRLGPVGEDVVRESEIDGLLLYRNDRALPRSFVVPAVEVVPDGDRVLDRLATGTYDPRRLAFVERPPPSGFTGTPGSEATGNVVFVTDDPEHVVLSAQVPARAFLVLSDQYYPGWEATVNGRPVAVLRANHAFRAVEVPAGVSRVEFRYAPASLRIGAWVSVLSIAAALVVLRRSRSREGS